MLWELTIIVHTLRNGFVITMIYCYVKEHIDSMTCTGTWRVSVGAYYHKPPVGYTKIPSYPEMSLASIVAH
ncbi:hypothetical protein Ptr902_01056 [Pyrenophora tritici-repentis]|nr:hypothetical protein Alg215_05398 [Pyrenophora tritici-repentis]KAI0589386.1 hypothetical protein Alg130_02961 [Pyrenophora tritici-repentis]KAI0612757.1 hypothetical protein TUN205_02989 [Pyrenophora tritici-repentis]KAI0625004.1 hypothetical protein TUN199_02990 [Pyrenophora tritici-repentis]KAI2486923.1 hypothetical protein Ptr902_01056 [Pyrenophora tritici-repentis]